MTGYGSQWQALVALVIVCQCLVGGIELPQVRLHLLQSVGIPLKPVRVAMLNQVLVLLPQLFPARSRGQLQNSIAAMVVYTHGSTSKAVFSTEAAAS